MRLCFLDRDNIIVLRSVIAKTTWSPTPRRMRRRTFSEISRSINIVSGFEFRVGKTTSQFTGPPDPGAKVQSARWGPLGFQRGGWDPVVVPPPSRRLSTRAARPTTVVRLLRDVVVLLAAAWRIIPSVSPWTSRDDCSGDIYRCSSYLLFILRYVIIIIIAIVSIFRPSNNRVH